MLALTGHFRPKTFDDVYSSCPTNGSWVVTKAKEKGWALTADDPSLNEDNFISRRLFIHNPNNRKEILAVRFNQILPTNNKVEWFITRWRMTRIFKAKFFASRTTEKNRSAKGHAMHCGVWAVRGNPVGATRATRLQNPAAGRLIDSLLNWIKKNIVPRIRALIQRYLPEQHVILSGCVDHFSLFFIPFINATQCACQSEESTSHCV
jgi:hypothetical protein